MVGDKLSSDQRTEGFAAQTVLIGIGAVVGSWLPYVLGEWFGVSKVAEVHEIPANLIWSFVIGAIVLMASILWTIFKTTEYTPEEMASFSSEEPEQKAGKQNFLLQLFTDIGTMPTTMKQLGLVQFFSWFALFGMWVFTTPAIAQHIYGLPKDDSSSAAFNDAGNWVGIIFGVYNLVSALYAFFILPSLARKYGRKKAHIISLLARAVGLLSFYYAPDKNFLIFSMVGVGMAWASILSMPYAILAGSLPSAKMGVYMGIFNLFITIPQIVNAIIGGPLVKTHVWQSSHICPSYFGSIFLVGGYCNPLC